MQRESSIPRTNVLTAMCDYYHKMRLVHEPDEHNVLGIPLEMRRYLQTYGGPWTETLAHVDILARLRPLTILSDLSRHNHLTASFLPYGMISTFEIKGGESKLAHQVPAERANLHGIRHAVIIFDSILTAVRVMLICTDLPPRIEGVDDHVMDSYMGVARRMDAGKPCAKLTLRAAMASDVFIDVTGVRDDGDGYVIYPPSVELPAALRVLLSGRGTICAHDPYTMLSCGSVGLSRVRQLP